MTLPLAARLAERPQEHPVPHAEYSDVLQRTLRDPKDLTNPMFMSPTTVFTPRGDREGDEAH